MARRQSLGGFLYHELHSGTSLSSRHFREKQTAMETILKVPMELESALWMGVLVCLDCFLFVFTWLPVRAFTAAASLLYRRLGRKHSNSQSSEHPSEEPEEDEARGLCDILRLSLIICVYFALGYFDVSWMYHTIRGQSAIKLYVVFNMLEVLDRLLSSLGQDLLDAMYFAAAGSTANRREHFGTMAYFFFTVLYASIHSVVIFCQILSLNVAVNSQNNSLLPLVLSNQFVELKSSVFKSCDEKNLFKITFLDMVERFQMSICLCLVTIRNMSEVQWDAEFFWSIMMPFALILILSEFLLDNVKHVFVTKFNNLSATLYSKINLDLCERLVTCNRNDYIDSVHVASSRLGFVCFPLVCVLLRVVTRVLEWPSSMEGIYIFILVISGTFLLKILVSIVVQGKSALCLANKKSNTGSASKLPLPQACTAQ